MKVKIDISCTPEEARTFFGLPDVRALNEALTEQMSQKMQESMAELSPDALMGQWMSLGGKMSEQFMGLMSGMASGGGTKKP
jgi:Family of unknown function (DUF6489)